MVHNILFVLGFAFLVKGADWLVEGSKAVARRFGISDFVIGLTVVSLGTSLPELLVNLNAVLGGNSGLAVGTIVGSNISNVLLILGISAIVRPIKVERKAVKYEIPFNLMAALLLGFLANTSLGGLDAPDQLSRLDGAFLVLFFVLFLRYVLRSSKEELHKTDKEIHTKHLGKSVALIVVGALALFLGGQWVVDGAKRIAVSWAWSEELVGLSILAIGTSLPELVTSAVAAYKNNADIALANVLGSNIFNVLWVLGFCSLIHPFHFEKMVNLDLAVFAGAILLVFLSLLYGKKQRLDRWNGIKFLLFYAAYLTYVLMRGYKKGRCFPPTFCLEL